MNDLFTLFTSRLQAAGVEAIVTGSVAAMFYGEPRLTHSRVVARARRSMRRARGARPRYPAHSAHTSRSSKNPLHHVSTTRVHWSASCT